MIYAIIPVLYLTGFILVGRQAFQQFRPHRFPACGKRHSEHKNRCYRRLRHDRSFHPFDRDLQAVNAAAWLALFWPATLLIVALMVHPPETDQETIARQSKEKEALERKITEQELLLGWRKQK